MNLVSLKDKTLRMILSFAVPSIIAMVLTSLITIVDGYFIGNDIGKEGIAAVNLGLPLLYIYLGLGIMIAVGGMTIAGIAMGAQDFKKCGDAFNQTVVTTIAISVTFSILVRILLNPVIGVLNIDTQVTGYFLEYYSIMLITYPVLILNSTLGMFIRGEGNPQLFMLINMLTVACNIVLDYLFLRVLHYGIKGVAVASLISVILGLLCMILYFQKKSRLYKLREFKFSKSILGNTIWNGSSEFIGQMSMSIAMFAYNWVIMKKVGVEGVAAFTIAGYSAYLFSMIIIGFGQGASPLISFSYGAGEIELSKEIRKKTNWIVLLVGAGAVLILFIVSGWYSSAFVKNDHVIAMLRSGLRIYVLSFLFSGINTITSFYFTSIGKAKESALISFARGLVILLICIFTLPVLFGMTGVWLVAPVTEACTIILSLVLIKHNARSEHPASQDSLNQSA